MIDTTPIKQAIDLRDLADRYTTLRKESVKELAGPCPKCGGDDRFHVTADWFFCRHCHEQHGDAIEFVRWAEGLNFRQAIERLTGAALPAQITKRTPDPKNAGRNDPEWQKRAAVLVEQAHRSLMVGDKGEPGRAYLLGRDLPLDSWLAFQVGYTGNATLPGTEGKQHAPAIVIPWIVGGKVRAVRYRFLQVQEYTDTKGNPRKEKQTALTDSTFAGVLYGGHALITGIERLKTLLIVEGEINAISCWLVGKDTRLDVLSLGSESATLPPAMIDHARQYGRVLTWLDKGERAKEVMAKLPGAYGLQSPRGRDANDLLQHGLLAAFLAEVRYRVAQSNQEKEGLYWVLRDYVQDKSDPALTQVIDQIAASLGMPSNGK